MKGKYDGYGYSHAPLETAPKAVKNKTLRERGALCGSDEAGMIVEMGATCPECKRLLASFERYRAEVDRTAGPAAS